MVGPTRPAARLAARTGTAFIALVVALGITVGLQAAPAQAATIHASLHIDRSPQPGGMYPVSIDVWLPMGTYESHGYYNNGARIQITFWADDPQFDPLLAPFANNTQAVKTWFANDPGYTAESDGIHLRFQFLVSGAVLDEDPYSSLFGDLQDEIYFIARFIDGDGAVSSAHSNVATGYFCCGH